ncbi:MAG TPA: GntR family transcriptional regulator [Acetobacteraceae bacterium]|nr:GntR family transcriptional regulator [Acetobacteraceae bacterium]
MGVEGLRPLDAPQLVRDRAAEEVRNAIISGRLAPGTRLVERELCAAMGISRASVREIVRRLEAERLIEVEPHRGPVVRALSRRQASEIYEIRAMLESLLIRRFTERASEAEIAALREVFAEVKAAAKQQQGGPERILGLMQRFYAHLMAVAQHEAACEILEGLNARISWLRLRAMAKPGRIEASLMEIGAVLEAVSRRDAAVAAALMQRSTENACQAALEQIG